MKSLPHLNRLIPDPLVALAEIRKGDSCCLPPPTLYCCYGKREREKTKPPLPAAILPGEAADK